MQNIELLEKRQMLSASIGSGPVLNPAQFGATYNGHTDDSAAIQAAINALPASGGTVFLTGVSAVGPAGIHLIGRTNVLLAAAPGDGIVVTGVPTPTQNWLQYGQWGAAAIAVSKCNSCEIDNLTINANGMAVLPIGMAGNGKTVVANNTIKNTAFQASIYAIGNTADIYTGNTIIGSTNYARGLWIGNGHAGELEIYPTISNNYISGLSATGIGTISYGATISGNTVLHCAGAGLALSSGGLQSTSYAVVKNNVFNYNGFHGIQADCMTDAYTASNVTLSGNVCSYNANSGIYVVRASNWTVSGNTCDNNTVGIYIGSSSGITASNNTCDDTRTGAARTQLAGIQVVAYATRGVSHIVLSGNQIFNNTQDGIFATTSGGVINLISIIGNNVGNNGRYNIAVVPSIAGTISGWTVSGNAITGLAATMRLGS